MTLGAQSRAPVPSPTGAWDHPPWAWNRDEAADLVARWVRHWEQHGFGYWCVREPGSESVIGCSGVKRMLIHRRPVLNLVHRFAPETWGRGFATEAAAAVKGEVDDHRYADLANALWLVAYNTELGQATTSGSSRTGYACRSWGHHASVPTKTGATRPAGGALFCK